MKVMGCDPSLDPRVARLIDANLDRAREGHGWWRTVRSGPQRPRGHPQGLATTPGTAASRSLQTGAVHGDGYGLEHPAQLDRHSPRQVVAANCGRVQEALRVLEEYGRNIDPSLAQQAAGIRTGSATWR